MKVPNNGTLIGDDENPGSMKDLAETGDYKNTSILSISLKDGERFYGGGSYQVATIFNIGVNCCVCGLLTSILRFRCLL